MKYLVAIIPFALPLTFTAISLLQKPIESASSLCCDKKSSADCCRIAGKCQENLHILDLALMNLTLSYGTMPSRKLDDAPACDRKYMKKLPPPPVMQEANLGWFVTTPDLVRVPLRMIEFTMADMVPVVPVRAKRCDMIRGIPVLPKEFRSDFSK